MFASLYCAVMLLPIETLHKNIKASKLNSLSDKNVTL